MPEHEIVFIDDELWERMIELTGGGAALCYQCGVCTATCPWGEVKQEPLSVRKFMRQAQLGFQNGNDSLWLCMTCAQCEAYCPRGVNITDIFRGLRTIAWEQRTMMAGLPSLLWSVYWNNNPWSQPPSQRSGWAKGLDIPAFNPQEHEILLYSGCTASYDRRAQNIARALVELLQSAGVSFGYLGEDEPCCGEAVLSVGHKPYFLEIAQSTSRLFQERGVADLVTISPHCYDVFKNHYPASAGSNGITPHHYTRYLQGLIEDGRLIFDGHLDAQVTFQDPCYLGRHNGEYQAPRKILATIPGVELVEMENHGLDALCCGGGGGRMWLETPAGERFSDLRVEQAAQTGAYYLVTACPFCAVCMEDSTKMKKGKSLQVLDVAEIAVLALENK